MKEDGRRIVITEKASVIQKAFSILLAGAQSQDDVIPSTREELQEFARQDYHNLILDLRAVEGPPARSSRGVENVRASQVGRVLVVSCEISNPGLFHQIEELCRPHFFPEPLIASLLALVHMVF